MGEYVKDGKVVFPLTRGSVFHHAAFVRGDGVEKAREAGLQVMEDDYGRKFAIFPLGTTQKLLKPRWEGGLGAGDLAPLYRYTLPDGRVVDAGRGGIDCSPQFDVVNDTTR